ncbi:MAG: GNAT family N-acetyltransferase [Candidatus Bathyarchaeota archaeon]|nr:GNAT family N-acetyltransferase [Candidatus Bathyarchaeota archaeon]
MNQNAIKNVRIIELVKQKLSFSKLKFKYFTKEHYAVTVLRKKDRWEIKLVLEALPKPTEKQFEGGLFQDFVNEPRVFAAELEDKEVGWIELGFQKWNNRMRIWELLVEEGFRREGMGTLLVDHAIKLSKERKTRMLVVETQSCNILAVNFYLKNGFELIGFDIAAYSNEDIERKEVRLEFALKIKGNLRSKSGFPAFRASEN